eukprot:TRINITY_DN71307_c0_g1_i1.p1 TRINITY_DN71307_c0_g1~~TRINITY_DN71307_c0_g1_i1.p1  ORF type:complete len:510 (-),score=83.73 TRINITY_DN71307_c0_g1_i1:51-1580(-)
MSVYGTSRVSYRRGDDLPSALGDPRKSLGNKSRASIRSVHSAPRSLRKGEVLLDSDEVPWYHPEKRNAMRIIVLVLLCFFTIGGYFAYDSVGNWETQIESDFGVSESKFSLVYSVYTFPNIVLPFLGGWLVDQMGINAACIITAILTFSGTTLVAIAPYLGKSFTLMVIGRLIYGFGAETGYVASNSVSIAWYRNFYLALMMGILVSAGRAGSYLTFGINAWVDRITNSDYRAALIVAAGGCAVSLVAAVLYVVCDKIAEYVLGYAVVEVEEDGEHGALGPLISVKDFPPDFWFYGISCMIYYSAIFPFQSSGTALLENRYGLPHDEALDVMSLLPLSSMIASPILGWLCDCVGYKVYWVIAGEALMTLAFILVPFTKTPPVISILLLGAAYSIVPASLWPCHPLLVPDGSIGIAFGLLSSMINLGLTFVYMITGSLSENALVEEEYINEMGFLLCLAAFGMLSGVVWLWLDRARGTICNKPGPGLREEFNNLKLFFSNCFARRDYAAV